ncbi:hypothetical protein BDV26DRAFT_293646 [Aspergillus bertholletiae]|uniref:Uncharacterized protein n=1 Tax=Aspergillus bertholletiae TaxID=1226010 RepID=A0A5N7B648_9EURO|nr:hypothetical protein BDV26DRAFT_293646 [Aspergillus bertholletiae]
MDGYQAAKNFLHDNPGEVARLYMIERWELSQIQQYPQNQLGFELQLTDGQLKTLLGAHSIKKNLGGEALIIKSRLGSRLTNWDCLVLVDNVLLDNIDVEKSCRRKNPNAPPKSKRNIDYIDLSFRFGSLTQPEKFRSFQRLLFYTRSHFESCFESGRWAPDSRGLYARNADLQADLTNLSNMHNKVSHALTEFRAK